MIRYLCRAKVLPARDLLDKSETETTVRLITPQGD